VHLGKRYRALDAMGAAPDTGDADAALRFLSWVIANVAPACSGLRPTTFEALIVEKGGPPAPRLVCPMWALSVPVARALGGRLPARPVIRSTDADLQRAYEGLLEHFECLYSAHACASVELSRSAVIWRIAALSDCLVDDVDALDRRLHTLHAQVKGHPGVSEIERSYWRTLDPSNFAQRRNALTHFKENGRWDFSSSAESVLGADRLEELMEATAAMSLAVIASVAEGLEGSPPPRGAWSRVWRETEWLDDHF
jgi:hypothetical protein